MFNCQSCGVTSKPGETQTTIIAETRDVTYVQPAKPYKKEYDEDRPSYKPKVPRIRTRTAMSFKEIVREIKVCLACASKHKEKVA